MNNKLIIHFESEVAYLPVFCSSKANFRVARWNSEGSCAPPGSEFVQSLQVPLNLLENNVEFISKMRLNPFYFLTKNLDRHSCTLDTRLPMSLPINSSFCNHYENDPYLKFNCIDHTRGVYIYHT